MVSPTLKVCVPTLFRPVSGEAPVVAPDNVQVLTVTAQLSVLVGFGVVTEAEHNPAVALVVILAGQVSTGGSVSFTVTVKLQVELLPQPSVAVTVTVVVPTGKVLPDAGTAVIVTAPVQFSVAVGVKLTAAPQIPGVLLTVILAGQVSTGGVLSILVL